MEDKGQTDKAGHYCVVNVRSGDYFMTADDADKGYPNMHPSFYSAQTIGSKVSLTAKDQQVTSDLRIPYKAAFLKVQLTDSRTGKQIIPMFFNLVARTHPDYRFMRGSMGSTGSLLLPPGEDIYFTVSAPGYREWPGDGSKGTLLNLLPGSTKNLRIALQPITP